MKSKKRLTFRIILGVIVIGLYIAGFFMTAGRLDWTEGWVFIALMVLGQSIHTLYIWRKSPELLKHRSRVGSNTKKWDKAWLTLFAVLYLVIIYTAALDAGRFQWSSMPGWLWPVGAAMYLVFHAFVTWAMAENPHFEKTVRIQHDRGHRVVDTGPYRIVRHPGYAFIIPGYFFSPPLLLGSWWALAPAFLTAGWLVFRTVKEDRTLLDELEGYKAYSQLVRYRLIPLVW